MGKGQRKAPDMRTVLNVAQDKSDIAIENSEDLANELYEIARLRRELEKREGKLKTFFKGLIGVDGFIRVGRFMMSLKDGSMTSFDREKLLADMGEAFVAKYLVETKYKRFDIIKDRVA